MDYHGTTVEGGGAVVIDKTKSCSVCCSRQTDVLNALEVDVK
ncbi:MAG: hypothetical protein R2852_05000 [Bacteroidia bacterium]